MIGLLRQPGVRAEAATVAYRWRAG